MTEILSLWRFPLDQVAQSGAERTLDNQPRCSIGYGENFSAMTIYNYGYYISQPGATNDSALIAMFAAMSPGAYGTGGLAFIPQQEFNPVHASAGGFSVPDQCNLIGSGGGGSTGMTGTPFYHFFVDYTNGTIFLNCAGNYTSGGKYFRGLAFVGVNIGSTADTCIYAATENCRAVNCTFTDIPVAFNAQGNGCGLEQCTIYYTARGGTKAIICGDQHRSAAKHR